MNKLKVVYLGNILSIARNLHLMPEVDLVGCVYEDEVDIDGYASPLYRTEGIKSMRVQAADDLPVALEQFGVIDLGFIANFGLILSGETIGLARLGFVNAHPGLLPENKGRHPIQKTLDRQDSRTGITLHQVTTKIDEGPILAQSEINVTTESNLTTLGEVLYNQAPALFHGYVSQILN